MRLSIFLETIICILVTGAMLDASIKMMNLIDTHTYVSFFGFILMLVTMCIFGNWITSIIKTIILEKKIKNNINQKG
jgi:energy-coupling factor transporter transmembrane protein EcfT